MGQFIHSVIFTRIKFCQEIQFTTLVELSDACSLKQVNTRTF